MMMSHAATEPVLTEHLAARIKIIAIYFPQFHAIPENDQWWGNGFTDWHYVKAGQPQFHGHNQPRVPFDGNYYDESNIDTLRWQIDLAKKYGLYGFCHYHYWFDGKQLLETPTNMMLENKELDFPFCLSWANETWSRRWDGRDNEILMRQTHPPKEDHWLKHFNYLIHFWQDERAIKVDGKPVFVIYRPQRIPRVSKMLDFWRQQAKEHGLKGLYFIAQKQYEHPAQNALAAFDAEFQFQPFEAIHSPTFAGGLRHHSSWFKFVRTLPEWVQDHLRALRARWSKELTFFDYEQVWQQIVSIRENSQLTTYPGAFADWDNAARYKERATIYRGASPERFEFWLSQLLQGMEARNLPEKFIFFNAWNEWAEGAYLEPDEQHQYAYLEAIRRVLYDDVKL